MLTRAYTRVRILLGSDEGATAVEYALMIAGVALLIVAAVFAVGGNVLVLFEGFAAESARWIAL